MREDEVERALLLLARNRVIALASTRPRSRPRCDRKPIAVLPAGGRSSPGRYPVTFRTSTLCTCASNPPIDACPRVGRIRSSSKRIVVFPGAVRPEVAEDLTVLHPQVEVLNPARLAVKLR
jgi:hypothetical protein